ncbi:hypothetical protein [Streptomyces sp. ODS05-4]|uniref:hypothetical protein n=1 Tax=Streptomyces sp. ODS05-4 TaxID=2944939 RepID=UPI00210BC4DB|nr:hypothetical protein [Streptomyces sp. ODS05-4]
MTEGEPGRLGWPGFPAGGRRYGECLFCPEPDADVVIAVEEAASGPGYPVVAHRACAERHRERVLGPYDAAAWRAAALGE